jgi:hypothetical protein
LLLVSGFFLGVAGTVFAVGIPFANNRYEPFHAEDGDRHVSLAIGGLAVLEGPVPDHDPLMSTFADRIGACPRFAQRVRSHRFDLGVDLGAPQWVDHRGFDLAHHVRRIGLPQPGDDRALFRKPASRVVSRSTVVDLPI